jgi:hypothetical protein
MVKQLWTAALVAAIGIAAPVTGRSQVADDARDTATEQGRNAKKAARDLKPGDKTAADRAADAKDTATAKKAKHRKEARAKKNRAKDALHEKTR